MTTVQRLSCVTCVSPKREYADVPWTVTLLRQRMQAWTAHMGRCESMTGRSVQHEREAGTQALFDREGRAAHGGHSACQEATNGRARALYAMDKGPPAA